MSLFIAIACAITLAALFHVLRPLARRRAKNAPSRAAANVAIYRDQLAELEGDVRSGALAQDQYEAARREIEKRLLEDVGEEAASPGPISTSRTRARLTTAGVATLLAAGTLTIYVLVGEPAAVAPPPGMSAEAARQQVTAQQIESMVARLAERMKEQPDNAEGWAMLGRSYAALGRFDDARSAFAQAVRLTPADAQLLADYADVVGMAQGRTLRGEPEKLVARALKVDPDNPKALALSGTIAFDKQDYRGAIRDWERLLKVGPSDPEFAQSIRESITEARKMAGLR